ncbi:MAG: sugar ABC transporter permease [candidate division KSB1 bacterium]|nr:sugar ABC transporter permease [candidate division KSB1 bacterium]
MPALVTLALFFFLPVLAAFLMSLTDFDIYCLADVRRARFVLFGQYIRLLQDPLFWRATLNTAYFVLVGGPLTILLALMASLILNSERLRGARFFRLAVFLPVITNMVAVAVTWRYLYHPHFGLFNFFLRKVGIGPVDWLGDPRFAMPAIILLAIWKNFGYHTLIFLAGLQTIPEDLYSAARLDGASWLQQHLHVTLPLLSRTLGFVTVITGIGYLQLFAEPYVMTQGGPLNATLSLVLYLYQQGFRWWRMGYSASVAFVLFAFMLAIGSASFLRRRRESA